MYFKTCIIVLVLVASAFAAPPDVSCLGLSKILAPKTSALTMRAINASISAWVNWDRSAYSIVEYPNMQSVLSLLGTVEFRLVDMAFWQPPADPGVVHFYPYNNSVTYDHQSSRFASVTFGDWNLITVSFGTDTVTVFVNESVAFEMGWVPTVQSDVPKFTSLSLEGTQTYAGVQVYSRALGAADVAARVRGDPSLCSPGPPPPPPRPPIAQSPPSPPFAPIQRETAPCISGFSPTPAFSEACYVVLRQPKLVCNGTRIVVGCGDGVAIRVRFPGRGDVRALSLSGACDVVVDTVEATRVHSMVIEAACVDTPCSSRQIMLPRFSFTGECETVPVVHAMSIPWPDMMDSSAMMTIPTTLPITDLIYGASPESIPTYRANAVLYLPVPEVLCPGSVLYAWIPYNQSIEWSVGCGNTGVCAPIFNYPAQNASIPYNVANVNGRFEAESTFFNGETMRLRLSYTGSAPMISSPNTAVQLSIKHFGGDETVFYEVPRNMAQETVNQGDYFVGLDLTPAIVSAYDALTDSSLIGASVIGPSKCDVIGSQKAWCVPRLGLSACASVCAGSRVEVVADGLSADTVLTVFGVVRLTADRLSWRGMTVGNATSDVECSGTCGMAAISISWTNPAGGCPPSATQENPADWFPCAWNAEVIHGTEVSLCTFTPESGQIIELWIEYVSFHDAEITIGDEKFILAADRGFPEDDRQINPGCSITSYNSFLGTKPLAPRVASEWRGASKPLDLGSYALRIQALERRRNVTLSQCRDSDVVATVRARVRYPDPPASNISVCTSSSPCVVSETTIASVSTYAVSIQSGGLHRCGGYMAGPRTVVTAAHCAIALSEGATVVYGTTNLSSPGLSVSARVAGSIVHEAYDGLGDRGNDISVLTLASAFSGVDPATVSTDQPAESLAAEFGWGNGSPSLRIALVDVIPKEACLDEFGSFPKSGVCMRRAGSEVVCQGDSGSPSAWIGAFSSTGDVLVRGILALPSWGASCKKGSALSIFTNLSYHAGWLDRATIASETCGGDVGCIAQITNGTWSASPIVDYAAVQQQNGSGAIGQPPSPSLRTQFYIANTSRQHKPLFGVIMAAVILIII